MARSGRFLLKKSINPKEEIYKPNPARTQTVSHAKADFRVPNRKLFSWLKKNPVKVESGKTIFDNFKLDEGINFLSVNKQKELSSHNPVTKLNLNNFFNGANKYNFSKDQEKFLQDEVENLLKKMEKIPPQSDQILDVLKSIDCHSGQIQNEQAQLLKTLISELKVLVDTEKSKSDELIKKMDQSIKKMDDAANSRLATWAAYATILSLLVGIIIFLYQQSRELKKDTEQKIVADKKAQQKAEELQNKITKIQYKYSELLNKQKHLESKITTLKNTKKELLAEKQKYYLSFIYGYDVKISEIDKKLERKKSKLNFVEGELYKLETYVLKHKENEEKKFLSEFNRGQGSPF